MSKKTEKEKKGKDKGIKVISSPLNFQHRMHVGVDSVNIQDLQALFENAGKTGHVLKVPDQPSIPVVPETNGKPTHKHVPGQGNLMKGFTPPPPCQSRNISGEEGVSNFSPWNDIIYYPELSFLLYSELSFFFFKL